MRPNLGASEQNRKSTAFWLAISITFVLSLLWLTGPPVIHSQGDTATATITASLATTVAPTDMVTPAEIATETPVSATNTPTLTDTPVPPTEEPTVEPTDELTEVPTPEPTMEPIVEPTEEPTPEPTEVPTYTPMPTVEPTGMATPTLTPLEFPSSLQERLQQWELYLIGLAVVLIVLVPLLLWRILGQGPPPEKEPVPPTPPVTPPPQVRLGVPYLESLGRPGGQIMFWLESLPVTVGRSPDNDLVIDDQYNGWETVSRRHAEIREDNGRYILNDNNSMNGVYVNGRRTGKNLLKDGFRVSFGQVEFIFRENIGREDPMSEDSRVKGAH